MKLPVDEVIGRVLAEEMRRDRRVVLFGAGESAPWPALAAEFGAARVRHAPAAESALVGAALGAAATGLRPVIDLSHAPQLLQAMSPLVNGAGKLGFVSGGQWTLPLVVLARTGAGACGGGHVNHNLEAMLVHAPGLEVVMPRDAAELSGLLKSAIRDDAPVAVFADVTIATAAAPSSGHAEPLPIGRAAVVRPGHDVTLVAYGKTVAVCLQAAERLAAVDLYAEVLDLRTLKPLDETSIVRSVRRTRRLVVVHEANRLAGVGAEVAALAADRAFEVLESPVLRLGGPDRPAAASWPLEQAAVPTVDDVVRAVRCLAGESACP